MSLVVRPELVEPMTAGLLGVVAVDGGPTPEQRRVLGAIVDHVWRRPDLDLGALAPLGPADLAAAVTGEVDRRRFHEVTMTLEACRHPQTSGQVARCEEYAVALGVDGPDLALFRSLVSDGLARAHADFDRFLAESIAARHEAGLSPTASTTDPEPALASRVAAFADLPEGTVGRAYLDFYVRHSIALPGSVASPLNHFFVAHDMTHVIAGIEPTAAGEIALSAFQMAMDDTPVNVGALLASLVVHEAGFGDTPTIGHEERVLDDFGAATLLAQELARGSACTADFSVADHFALAGRPLAEVRAEFGVPAPDDPGDGHHCW